MNVNGCFVPKADVTYKETGSSGRRRTACLFYFNGVTAFTLRLTRPLPPLRF